MYSIANKGLNFFSQVRCLYMYITSCITLSNITSPNILLLDSYFENLTIELYVLYVLNIYINFYLNWVLFIIQSLQQNVFLVTKISEEIFFVTKNTDLVTKYEFRH